MAIFEVEVDGKQFEVDAPDMQTAMRALQGTPQQAQSAKPQVDMGTDIAKSAAMGAAASPLGLSNLPELGARGLDWAVQKLGGGPRPGSDKPLPGYSPLSPQPVEQYSPPNLKTANEQYDIRFPFASPDIQKKIEQYTGKFYQPQTPEGQIAYDVGGFLPGMVGGPGGVLTRAATNVAAPYLASEAAGKALQGTGYETAGKMAAAVAAPTAAGRVLGARAALPSTKMASEEIKQAGADVYNANAQMVLAKQPGQNPASATGRAARDELSNNLGLHAPDSPRVWARLDQLENMGPGTTVSEIRSVRKGLNKIAKDTADNTERLMAKTIINKIDDTLEQSNPVFREANKNYAIGSQSERVMKKLDDALVNAETANSGLNKGNAIRQAFKPDVKKPIGYDKEAQRQLRQITGGNKAIRYSANLLGGGGGLGQMLAATIGSGGGYMAAGPLGAATGPAMVALGRALKGIENAKTKAEVRKLDALIRASAPAAKGNLRNSPQLRSALARLLLTGSPASP